MVYFVVGVVSCNMIINDELVNPTVLSVTKQYGLVRGMCSQLQYEH